MQFDQKYHLVQEDICLGNTRHRLRHPHRDRRMLEGKPLSRHSDRCVRLTYQGFWLVEPYLRRRHNPNQRVAHVEFACFHLFHRDSF